jgi:DNA primase
MRQTIAPYSLRAAPIPTVSAPVHWEEVEEALRLRRPELLVFEPHDALERLERDVLDRAGVAWTVDASAASPDDLVAAASREGDVVHLVDRRGRPCSVDLGL